MTATPQPTEDPVEPDTPSGHAQPTRLVLVRHAVTAQTGPLLSGRTPGIDLSDKGREQAKAFASSVLSGDAEALGFLKQTIKDAADSFLPNRKR